MASRRAFYHPEREIERNLTLMADPVTEESFDKQVVRDWLDQSGWNHEPPAPALPPDVVRRTQQRYLEAWRRITGPAA